MVQVPIRGYGHIVGQGYKHLKACQGLEDLHQSHGCGQETLVPYCMGFSIVFLVKWLPFLEPATGKSSQSGSHSIFYNLDSKVTSYPFCHILLVTQTNLIESGRGLHKDVKTQRNGSLGTILEAT